MKHLLAFLEVFAPKKICAMCLHKMLVDISSALDAELDRLMRDGRVRIDLGRCSNCDENLPVYSAASTS